jgi:hypothetical protein
VNVPTVVGFVNPMILVPGWVMQELSADELNQIVLHELAHLRRWDDWTNLAQKVVRALFFFHPAVWWIEQKMSLEREMACDDAVIAHTESPRAYAECLAHLAEKTLIQRGVALAQAALGRIRQTSLRVAQILDGNRGSAEHAWRPAVTLVAGFAMVCAVGISRAPRLIAFGGAEGETQGTVAMSQFPSGTSTAPVAATKVMFHEPARTARTRLHMTTQPRRKSSLIESAKAKEAPERAVVAFRGFSSGVRSSEIDSKYLEPINAGLRSGEAPPVAFTETLFVVLENGNSSDRRVVQIQMWRVMVLHPVVSPDSNKLPAKQA